MSDFGKNIKVNDDICPYFCPFCHTVLNKDFVFCSGCGASKLKIEEDEKCNDMIEFERMIYLYDDEVDV